jgi:hypothetical protein
MTIEAVETFIKEMRSDPRFASFADGVERDFAKMDIRADGSTKALAMLDELLAIIVRRELRLSQRLVMIGKVVDRAPASRIC